MVTPSTPENSRLTEPLLSMTHQVPSRLTAARLPTKLPASSKAGSIENSPFVSMYPQTPLVLTAASPPEKGSASSKKLARSEARFSTVPSAEMKPFWPFT